MEEKQSLKVEAIHRFLYAPSGRIYDPKDVFEVATQSDFDYLTKEHKLCKVADKDAEVTETEQDKQDKAMELEAKRVSDEKAEALKVIEEKTPAEPKAKASKAKK